MVDGAGGSTCTSLSAKEHMAGGGGGGGDQEGHNRVRVPPVGGRPAAAERRPCSVLGFGENRENRADCAERTVSAHQDLGHSSLSVERTTKSLLLSAHPENQDLGHSLVHFGLFLRQALFPFKCPRSETHLSRLV